GSSRALIQGVQLRNSGSENLFHHRDQVVAIEGAGVVRARLKVAPHVAIPFHGIEQRLLFDEDLVQHLLVEGADGTLKNVRNPKVLRRNQLGGDRERNLKNAAVDINLYKIGRIVAVRGGTVFGRVQRDDAVVQHAVDGGHEVRADGVQFAGGGVPQRFHLMHAAQAAFVRFRQ